MRRTYVFVGLFLIVATVTGTVLSSGNDENSEPKADKTVLQVQDKRLSKGDENAPVSIVEYVDILCPYCAKVDQQVLPQLKRDYIDTKKAHYEVRVVAMVAPDSQRAAEGAYCAAEQGKFWDYLDTAYRETWDNYYSQNKSPQDIPIFSDKQITSFADRVGLFLPAWEDCVQNGTYAAVISQNKAKMDQLQAYGTPHFLFNDQSYSGAPPYPFFQKALDAEYNKKVRG